MQYSLDCQWISDLEEVALPVPALFPNSCFICGKTHIQQNEVDIKTKKIFTLLVEVTIKTDAKNKTRRSIFTSKIKDHDLKCS